MELLLRDLGLDALSVLRLALAAAPGLYGGVATMTFDNSCNFCSRKIRISSYWAAGRIMPTDCVCEAGKWTIGEVLNC